MAPIAERFSNGELQVPVETVGELIDELSRLPRDVAVTASLGYVALLTLFTSASGRPRVEILDGDEKLGCGE